MKRLLILPFFIISVSFAQIGDSLNIINIKGNRNPNQESDPGPDVWMNWQEEPKPLNMNEFLAAIGYPEMAKQAGITGKVLVRVNVDAAGNYVQHILLKTPHSILSNAVESKLPMLKFTPAIQNDKPVICWVTIPVDFVLTNKKVKKNK